MNRGFVKAFLNFFWVSYDSCSFIPSPPEGPEGESRLRGKNELQNPTGYWLLASGHSRASSRDLT
jgi:hypothetical protein